MIKELRSGIDINRLNELVNDHFDNTAARGLLILYKGHIITEKYAPKFYIHTKMMGWSMTKSVGNALYGIAVKRVLP
eukprot:UN19328